jgi:VanZ family protein
VGDGAPSAGGRRPVCGADVARRGGDGRAALGFFAPIRFAALASVPRILALAAGCSVLIETAQYVLQLDRVSSVDDVLLNTAGAVAAALASRRWWRARQRHRPGVS